MLLSSFRTETSLSDHQAHNGVWAFHRCDLLEEHAEVQMQPVCFLSILYQPYTFSFKVCNTSQSGMGAADLDKKLARSTQHTI